MRKLISTFCALAIAMAPPCLAKEPSSTIELTDATVTEFVRFVNRWPQFRSALTDYLEREKEFFPNCDIGNISVNTISAFGMYDVQSAKKILKRKEFETIQSKMGRGQAVLMGVDTADPCGHDHRSWIFVGSEENFRIISDFIIVE